MLASQPQAKSPQKRLAASDRRNQLIDAAMRVFSERGFAGTTTREIARAAGVNEAIIFRFFPHKDDLYAAILERKSAEARTDALVDELHAAATAGDDAAVIRLLMAHLVAIPRRDPAFLRLMLHSALEGHALASEYRDRHLLPIKQFLVEFVRDRQRRGRFRPGDPQALVRALLAVPMHHNLVETLLPGSDRPLGDEIVDLYTSFVLAGLRGLQ